MAFHIDTLRDALVEAGLIALDRAPGPIAFVALELPEEGLLPQSLATRPGVHLPLGVPDPPEPDLAELARSLRLKPEALDLEDGLARDLLLVALIEAAEAIAAAAYTRGLTPHPVPAGFQEPGELDLLDADAAEVLLEDVCEGLKRLPPAAWQVLAEYFFATDAARARFLAGRTGA